MSSRAAAMYFRPIAPESADGPLYRAVERALLDAVGGGTFAPGDALPPEPELAAAFGVSVGTVRKAVDELVAEHIVVRRQGRGTFVTTHDASRLMFQFFHVERADGVRDLPVVTLLSFQRARAGEDAAQALQIPPGAGVIEIENVLRLQGRPVIHDRIVLPSLLFRGLTERRVRERPGTLYQFYQVEFGISVLRAVERARAVAADRATARVLGIALGAPVIEVRRAALSFNDRPVEYRSSAVDTTRHHYVVTLDRPSTTSMPSPD